MQVINALDGLHAFIVVDEFLHQVGGKREQPLAARHVLLDVLCDFRVRLVVRQREIDDKRDVAVDVWWGVHTLFRFLGKSSTIYAFGAI